MSDYDVFVRVSVPNAVFKTLRQVADAERTSVAVVIREVLRTYVPPTTTPRAAEGSVDEQVLKLNEKGMTDHEIAAELGISHSSVAKRRKRLLLPAHGWQRRLDEQRKAAS
ncbi:DNA-binding NarL/FixJ family response regulator [Curtobacterium flaccumfaciens]|jgi:DNA-binding NarL/FixJ family response regulator|uniref:DNA-binding NarL/FixJ family response regulator n=1 Tax=Curtobacterium salicis TaxID=1779862 RepID=A0ABX0T9Q7_9MICO|nr:helix-turn-helix domain-containing protein [Curtobacterium sp. WW7]NII42273.1 DNA-binding NarL/FixJ family response regulator [Curtobacterium sp. WW7]